MRFSVYIPVWNGEAWIGRAIDSVRQQTYEDWELVIGDNASTDATESIVNAYADPRIRYRRWPTFAEISENYNRTLLLCEGDWVQLLAADDRLDPRCLAMMSDRIDAAARADSAISMVVTACRRVDPSGRSADREWYRHGRVADLRDGLYDGGAWLMTMAAPAALPWNTGSVALSSVVVHELGALFRPETGVCADLELYMRVAAYGDTAYLTEPLLDFTVHGSSDGAARVRRNLERNEPLGPVGIALVAGLAVHEFRRTVSRHDRAAIRAAVARELLGRAVLHRHHPGGRGRVGAAQDVLRAWRWSARTAISPRQLAKAAAALLAPRRLLVTGRARLETRRRASADDVIGDSTPD